MVCQHYIHFEIALVSHLKPLIQIYRYLYSIPFLAVVLLQYSTVQRRCKVCLRSWTDRTSSDILPPCHEASHHPLNRQSRVFDSQIAFARQEPPHRLLHSHTTVAQPLWAQPLHVCNLTGSEEDLCFAKLEPITILQQKKSNYSN